MAILVSLNDWLAIMRHFREGVSGVTSIPHFWSGVLYHHFLRLSSLRQIWSVFMNIQKSFSLDAKFSG